MQSLHSRVFADRIEPLRIAHDVPMCTLRATVACTGSKKNDCLAIRTEFSQKTVLSIPCALNLLIFLCVTA